MERTSTRAPTQVPPKIKRRGKQLPRISSTGPPPSRKPPPPPKYKPETPSRGSNSYKKAVKEIKSNQIPKSGGGESGISKGTRRKTQRRKTQRRKTRHS